MRKLLIGIGALAALFVVAVVVAFSLFDAEQLREPITEYASEALGREVTLGELDLAFLPMPAVRAHKIRIAGHKEGAPAFADVEELRLRVALLPLLARRVVLRAVELDAPKIHVPFDRNGDPILPGPKDDAEKKSSDSAASGGETAAPDEGDASSEPVLAIDRIAIRDASVDAGPYKFSQAQVDGSFTLGGAANFDFELGDVRYAEDDVSLSGPVNGRVALGDSWSIDLDAATIKSGDSFSKPAGERLRLNGSLGEELSAAAIRDVRLQLGANEIPMRLALEKRVPEVTLEATRIDVADLVRFLGDDPPKVSGVFAVEQMLVKTEPLSVTGKGSLDDIVATLDGGPVEVSGPIVASGRRIDLRDATAMVAGNSIGVSGGYDLKTSQASFSFDAKEAKVENLVDFISGRSELAGILGAAGEFTLGDGMGELNGKGRFAITPGSIKGFSLVRELVGPLSEIPLLVAQFKGKDLSKYQQEEFQNLSADYEIRNGVLHTQNLLLEYGHASARLRGSVNIETLALDLSGDITLSEELGDELAGAASTRKRVIPISRIRGTVNEPKFALDARSIQQIASAFLLQDRAQGELQQRLDGELGDKIDEKLGPGAREAVEDIFGTLLGVPKRERAPKPAPEPEAAPEAVPPAADDTQAAPEGASTP